MSRAPGSLVAGLASLALLATPVSVAGIDDGMVVGATKLVDHGTDAERFDLVIVAEGYRLSEQALFAGHARALADQIQATAPFDRLARAINVWRIDVASFHSGADDPVTCAGTGLRPRTYFDAAFCTGNLERSLLTVSHATLLDVVDDHVPAWDQIVVLVNSPVSGGLGGSVTITSLAPGWSARVLHAIGHAAFGLADEYDHFDGCAEDVGRGDHPVVEPVAANVTVETSRYLLKWGDLVAPTTPVPTTENPDPTCTSCDARPDPAPGTMVVGLYEGGHNFPCGAYRAAFGCAMRDLGPFCPVCQRRIARTLEAFLEDATNEPPACDTGGPYLAECAGPVTPVALDGSSSSDPDGDELLYRWSGSFEGGAAQGSPAAVGFAGIGTFPVSLEVSDGIEARTCAAEVVVEDTTAPALAPPADVSVQCSEPGGIDLGDPTVADACEGPLGATNDAPPVIGMGTTTVTWRAVDSSGNEASALQRVTIADGTAPRFSIAVSPDVLWPPNHQLVPVVVTVDVADDCDETPRVRLVSISSSEGVRESGSGGTEVDIVGAEMGTDDRQLELRAERSGNGGGRVYTIVYEAVDSAGNATEASARVVVPPDRGAESPRAKKKR